jgi:ABC-type transport system involved in Fe-S cluster assembly fused permease/ATPase subunit
MVDGSLPSSATFNAAVEESRISMEACNATQAEMAEIIRGVMLIVDTMEITAGMETVGTMEIVVEMPTMVKTETGDETEMRRTTGNHAVHISRAARM